MENNSLYENPSDFSYLNSDFSSSLITEETENEKKEEVNKHQLFMDDAETAVNRIFQDLEKLEKVSNRKKYDYSEDDISHIFSSIDERVEEIKKSFKDRKPFKF